MPKTLEGQIIPPERIESRIFMLRGRRVMLDRDLAELYGVTLKRLNEQVKRNSERFPDDFMLQLTLEEGKAVMLSRSQIATMKRGRNIKYRPYVFSEHGAVMLANVLRSPIAIRASIQVVRAFVNLRRMLTTHDKLARKIDVLERRLGKHDVELQEVFRILRKLLEPPPSPRDGRPVSWVQRAGNRPR